MIISPQSQFPRALQPRGRRPPVFSLLGGGTPPGLAGRGVLFGNKGETVSITRATAKVVGTLGGGTASVSSGQLAVDYRGLSVEVAHTNDLLHSRDLSNAAWTKSNAAAVTGPGSDGTGSAGSVLTASANDGYAAQAIAAAAVARTTSVLLRRIVGTGTIQISRNGGANYTDVTSQVPVGGAWVSVQVTTTVLNPEIRIKLGSAGDSIGVDYVQDELGSFAHSPISTGAAGATCNADVITLASGIFNTLPIASGQVDMWLIPEWGTGQNAAGMVVVDTRSAANTGGVEMFVQNDTLNFVTRNGAVGMTTITSSALSWVVGQAYRFRGVWGAGKSFLYRDDSLVASDVTGTAHMPNAHTAFNVGSAFTGGFQADGFISNLCFSTQ